MTSAGAERAVELLIGQAWSALGEDRFASAASTAERAAQAAEHLRDPSLLVRALSVGASALRMSGDFRAALARFTRILGMAEDPNTTSRFDSLAVNAVARAYSEWVESAHFAGGVPVRELFGVLDAADRWLTATGHHDWRAAILFVRSMMHTDLGELNEAVAAAQEALATYRPDAPGYPLASYRAQLGHVLHEAERDGEAEPQYQAILDDPTSDAYSRKIAWTGLAWCALARSDPQDAFRHAQAAVHAAEPLGDNSLTPALEVLVAAHRAAGNLDAAWQAATLRLQAARRLGTRYKLYYALRGAADVALDRADHPTARTLLDELERHATALDADTGTTIRTDAAAHRRRRLDGVDVDS